jgi:hypothetical protein
MPRLLIVHYQRPHFEIVLALLATLQGHYEMEVWSNCLHVFNRRELLSELKVKLFDSSNCYDALVIVSGEYTPTEAEAGPELWSLLQARPALRIMHRLGSEQRDEEIRLFPKSKLPFIPVTTNLTYLKDSRAPESRAFLIQGNVENRRNYNLLPGLLQRFPASEFHVIGIKVGIDLPATKNLRTWFNQSERDFHSICANSTFILPLIDPIAYGGYFRESFTSSILIGFSYDLPFIAHRGLFDLYPIVGYSYSTDDELLQCIETAAYCTELELREMRQRIAANRTTLIASGILNVRSRLQRLGV